MSSEPTTPENLRAATRPGTSICHRRWSKLFQEFLFDQCGNTTLAFAILRLSVHLFLPRDLSLSLCDHQTLAPTRMRKAGSQPRDPYVSCRVSVSFLFNRMLITGLWRWALILSSQKTDWQFQESALRSPSHGKWQAASSMPTLGPPIVCLASLGSFSCEQGGGGWAVESRPSCSCNVWNRFSLVAMLVLLSVHVSLRTGEGRSENGHG